jgi:uncharacterized protein YihD (DUF1040 family)
MTLKDFIEGVQQYPDLDTALENLPDEYIEFYLKNMNTKSFNKALKKYLNEDYEPEFTQTLGNAPIGYKYKKIHYKGEYIILKYDPRYGWVPSMSFRSIVNATKYIKKIADEYMS